jgi:hypothetical protein
MEDNNMGVMSFLGVKGDTKIEWDPDNDDEIAIAKEKFDLATQHRFTAHRIRSDGKPGRVMREFDHTASKIVMVPVIGGG